MSENSETGRIKAMLGNAESRVKELQGSIHDAESRIAKAVENATKDMTKRANLMAGEASLQARRKTEDAKLAIRDRPLEAVAAGIAIGLVAGVILGISFRCCSSSSGEGEDMLTEE